VLILPRKSPLTLPESGVDVPGESQLSLPHVLRDGFRISYHSQYLEQMQHAIDDDGADIRGYFAWSLMDNFEWKDGYKFRFGVHYVDYNTAARTRYAKDSAVWYKKHVEAARRAEREKADKDRRAAGSECGRRGKMSTWWDYWSNAILRSPFLPLREVD